MSNQELPATHRQSDGEPIPGSSSPEAAASGEGARLDFSTIIETLLRRKWVILLTCVVVAGLVAGYTYTQPSIYRASSLVKVGSQGGVPKQLAESIGSEAAVDQSRSLSGEIGVLRNSLELATRVAEELRAREQNQQGAGFPILSGPDGRPSSDTTAVARRILQRVSFAPRAERKLIEIAAESRAPKEAAAIANSYAAEYKAHSQEKARASVQAAQQFLRGQLQEQRAKIDRLEQRWKSFMQNQSLLEQGSGGEHLTAKLNELKSRRDELSFELEKAKTQLKLLRRQLNNLQPQLENNITEEQRVSSLRSQIGALQEKIGEMKAEAASYYATNPDLEGDTTRIRRQFPDLARLLDRIDALEDRKQNLNTELVEKIHASQTPTVGEGGPIARANTLRQNIAQKQLRITELKSQISALDSEIARYDSKLERIPDQRIQRKQLERQLEQAKSFHETIVSKLQRVNVAEESVLGYVQVVQSALVPSFPIRPDFKKNTILGILLGLAFGVGLAFLREATDTRIRRPEDVEGHGHTLLGVVPSMDPEIAERYDGQDFIEVDGWRLSTCLVPLLNPWSSVTENYRLIRANLGHNNGEGPARSLLVTSALKGEGKTVTAVNLALTEAMSGRSTLLIDADMRKPSAHEALGISRSPGLSSVLTEGTNGEALRETLLEDLFFLPAGVPEGGPANVLDPERFQRFLEHMREQFDVVVIDTPPSEAASDSIIIGTEATVKAVVVSAAQGDARALNSVTESLETAGVPVAGVVLNRFDDKTQLNADYGYSYYGHDGEYADYRTASIERNAEVGQIESG